MSTTATVTVSCPGCCGCEGDCCPGVALRRTLYLTVTTECGDVISIPLVSSDCNSWVGSCGASGGVTLQCVSGGWKLVTVFRDGPTCGALCLSNGSVFIEGAAADSCSPFSLTFDSAVGIGCCSCPGTFDPDQGVFRCNATFAITE